MAAMASFWRSDADDRRVFLDRVGLEALQSTVDTHSRSVYEHYFRISKQVISESETGALGTRHDISEPTSYPGRLKEEWGKYTRFLIGYNQSLVSFAL